MHVLTNLPTEEQTELNDNVIEKTKSLQERTRQVSTHFKKKSQKLTFLSKKNTQAERNSLILTN